MNPNSSELMAGLSGAVRNRAKALASVVEETADAAATPPGISAPPEISEGPGQVINAGRDPRDADGETIADLSATPPEASRMPGAAIDAGLEHLLEAARDTDALAPVVSGSRIRPDFVIPFEPSLSRLADRTGRKAGCRAR